MNYLERNKKMRAAEQQFDSVEFTSEQLEKIEGVITGVIKLVLHGPDCEFERELHNYVDFVKKLLADDEKKLLDSINLAGPIYGVEWIEIEFGSRPEGWALFVDLAQCVKETKAASNRGAYDGGYIGPERPLCYYELPVEGLDLEYVKNLKKSGKVHTSNYWSPKYRGQSHGIK